ncbi:MAG: hypothetical protein KJ017_07355 [Alphaproteobacteria bacterium]|jgi:hypothetical protein|nr:hypothetical protein [Alphaproteobacteria bacterium]
MPTHAELASKLLKDASTFFRTLASQNRNIEKQMSENATVFDKISNLVVQDPYGKLDDTPHAVLAGRLLKDAAGFFRKLGEQNKPIQDQMNENANVYDQMGDLVMQNPLGYLD